MTLRALLFSRDGRITRKQYWLGQGLLLLAMAIAIAPFVAIADLPQTGSNQAIKIAAFVLFIGVTIVASVAGVFIAIKRFHDRDKRWFWIGIGAIPYIGGLWLLIELGMLRGTPGPNRFGVDPLGRAGAIADVFGPIELDGAPPRLDARRPAPTNPSVGIAPSARDRW